MKHFPLGRLVPIFAALAALFFSACSTGGVIDTSRTFKRVVIDPGHGAHDSGATSRYAGKEKDLALDVGLRLRAKLEAAGFDTVMTRKSDVFIPLDKRAAISNRQSNSIFVAIHFNDSPNPGIRGSEVYYKSRCSTRIAQNILEQIAAIPGFSNRGVRTANFRVLVKNRYPAVLVECGYLSNPAEGSRFQNGAALEALADAITRGIVIQRNGGAAIVAAN
jgi:N-acetylmuramoyl-L-alanine amidase